MTKKILANVLLALLISFNAIGQITSFNLFSLQGTYVPLVGGTNVAAIQVDDAFAGPFPLGFTFNYLGNNYTQFWVSSNGMISFGAGNATTLNDLTTGVGRPILAPLWDDNQGNLGNASFKTEPVNGSNVFTFEWLNWRWRFTTTAATMSFQVKIYQATNSIEFIYRQEPGALTGIENASIGITAVATGAGNFLSLNNSTATPVASSTVETNNIASKPATGQRYIFTTLNDPALINGSSSVAPNPFSFPPIANFAYNKGIDTVWVNSPYAFVNNSIGDSANYWDIIGMTGTRTC
nr:hypothetical protein [Bacteroidia bacterium]